MILAIETSCDDTSVSLCDIKTGKIIDTLCISQVEHEKFGGVVPELASRKHFTNIYPLIDVLFEKNSIKKESIKYIAVTYAPGLMGSLLVGVTVAKILAFSLDVEVIPVHHIEGHIMSNFMEETKLSFPYMTLVISGGHTQIVKVDDYFKYQILGDTLDDSVGEAFDKVAKMMALGYPGGPIVDKLAGEGKEDLIFPRPLLNKKNLDFSFSGLKTAVKVYIEKNKDYVKEDVAYSFQNAVCDVLYKKTLKAMKEYNVKNLVLAGGVAANSQLRKVFSECKYINTRLPEKKYCTDNAGMIAKAAYFRLKKDFNVLKKEKYKSLNPVASMRLDMEEKF